MLQLDMSRDMILCLTIIGCVETAEKWTLHRYLGETADYRKAMHVSTLGKQIDAIRRLKGLLVGDGRRMMSCC